MTTPGSIIAALHLSHLNRATKWALIAYAAVIALAWIYHYFFKKN